MTVPALLYPNGSLTNDPEEKASLFVDMLDRNQSNETVTMTRLVYHDINSLSLNLVRIFPLFLKKTADILSPKIAVSLCKCTRAGNFNTSWRAV